MAQMRTLFRDNGFAYGVRDVDVDEEMEDENETGRWRSHYLVAEILLTVCR